MHFVTGGAFNGKKKWVAKFYELQQKKHQWHSFYKKQEVPVFKEEIIVLEGLEQFVRALLEKEGEPAKSRHVFKEQLLSWKKENRTFILIGTDITKGIVPINAFDRQFRDTVGWCFQDAATAAARVDTVWYGIPETIKEEKK